MEKTVFDQKAPIPMDIALQKKVERLKTLKKISTEKVYRELVKEEDEKLFLSVTSGEVRAGRSANCEAMRAAYQVAQLYADKHAKYYKHRPINAMQRVANNRGILGCCTKTVYQAELLNAPLAEYLEAQFWHFDKKYRKAPRYQDICSSLGPIRYEQWLTHCQQTGHNTNVVNMAAGRTINPENTSLQVQKEYFENLLRLMIKGWNSELHVWELFGKVDEPFPLWFRQGRALWRSLYDPTK